MGAPRPPPPMSLPRLSPRGDDRGTREHRLGASCHTHGQHPLFRDGTETRVYSASFLLFFFPSRGLSNKEKYEGSFHKQESNIKRVVEMCNLHQYPVLPYKYNTMQLTRAARVNSPIRTGTESQGVP
jgi:hypothetical protein